MSFTHHLHRLAAAAITSIPADRADEIYAISFFIDNENDDPREPNLIVGYNTEAQVRLAISSGRPSAPDEARWNYAFWLQNELVMIGNSVGDPAGAAAREAWIKDLELWYDEPAEATDRLDVVGPRAQQIESHFNEACCRLAGALHASGAITNALGRPVPVLIHELEYYEQIAVRTEAANPPGLAADFTSWDRNG